MDASEIDERSATIKVEFAQLNHNRPEVNSQYSQTHSQKMTMMIFVLGRHEWRVSVDDRGLQPFVARGSGSNDSDR